ncbi:Cupin type-1 domain-containing protein [Heracleum sosnowskyi]|uniref:Germin-like protein n=1 Tax=Heracleum sosnowskyi TaxID=360622 RepID=A0AAD8IJ31_9APIA|nr:Cupin type-1 domain-containing protein [Heracleum sosnowskyi]
MKNFTLFLLFLAITCTISTANVPNPLQDFCVADFSSSAPRVNGYACLDPKLVKAEHFSVSGLHLDCSTSNSLGTCVHRITVAELPGLNTLGLSNVRVNYAQNGVVPPHIHPRATEILTVLKGRLRVGFVTGNPENRLITKVLGEGDVFVFPQGLAHFQQNVANGNTTVLAFLSAANPGVITVADAVFGSNPPIRDDILEKAFQTDASTINAFKSQF